MGLGRLLTGIGYGLALSCSTAQVPVEGQKPLASVKAQPPDYEDGPLIASKVEAGAMGILEECRPIIGQYPVDPVLTQDYSTRFFAKNMVGATCSGSRSSKFDPSMVAGHKTTNYGWNLRKPHQEIGKELGISSKIGNKTPEVNFPAFTKKITFTESLDDITAVIREVALVKAAGGLDSKEECLATKSTIKPTGVDSYTVPLDCNAFWDANLHVSEENDRLFNLGKSRSFQNNQQ